MKPFGITSNVLGASIATLMALRGIKRKSLSPSGAIAAWIVGYIHIACGLRGFVLLFFYLIGTKATKYHLTEKHNKDATLEESSVRGAQQVLACSFISAILSLLHAYYCGEERRIDYENEPLASLLTCSILSHHATCMADTLASEMGILAKSSPILITQPWKHVPAGTNGGITLSGTIWSCIGGLVMGLCYVLMDLLSNNIIPLQIMEKLLFGAACGAVGSLVDSILGATLQISYYDTESKRIYDATKLLSSETKTTTIKHISGVNILTNVQVNLVSVGITCVLGGYIFGPMIFS